MTTALLTPTGRVPLVGLAVRTPTGLVNCSSAVIRKADGSLLTWWGSLSASPNKDTVQGVSYRSSTSYVQTESVTVGVEGGTEPIMFHWVLDTSDGTPWTITNANGATTSFIAHVSPGGSAIASFACTVTDKDGNSVAVSVNAEATSIGTF